MRRHVVQGLRSNARGASRPGATPSAPATPNAPATLNRARMSASNSQRLGTSSQFRTTPLDLQYQPAGADPPRGADLAYAARLHHDACCPPARERGARPPCLTPARRLRIAHVPTCTRAQQKLHVPDLRIVVAGPSCETQGDNFRPESWMCSPPRRHQTNTQCDA